MATKTQIQLPDELYRRAKRFSAEREMSLAELVRRALESMLARYPAEGDAPDPTGWQLPRVDGGGVTVPLERLRELAFEDEASRSFLRGEAD